MWSHALLVVFALCIVSSVVAHVPFMENPDGDWSWNEPFDIPLGQGRKGLEFVCDITQGQCSSLFDTDCVNDSCTVAPEFVNETNGQTFPLYDDDSPLSQSRIFFGDLYKKDTYDVLRFSVQPGMPQLVLALTPLTFNCEKLEDFYPSIALIVPTGTGQGARDLTSSELTGPNKYPWAHRVPAGFQVIVVHQPREARAVFEASPEEGGGPGYLLPVGLNTECLQDQPPSCNFNNTINGIFLPIPSDEYRVVVWDTKKLLPDKSFPHAYAINFGASENETPIELGRIRLFQDSHVISYLVKAPGCDTSPE